MNDHGEIRFHRAVHIDGVTLFPQTQEGILYNLLRNLKIPYILLRKETQSRKMTPEEYFETGFVEPLNDMVLFVFQLFKIYYGILCHMGRMRNIRNKHTNKSLTCHFVKLG